MIYSYRQNFTPSTMYSSNYGEQLLYTYFTLYNNINNKNVLTNVLYADIVPISDKLLQTVQSNPQAILSKMTEKCSDSMYNSYENILLTDKITNNELFVEKLKDYDSNAELIKEGKNKEERFEILSSIAEYQLNILNNAEKIKLLGEKDSI